MSGVDATNRRISPTVKEGSVLRFKDLSPP